MLTRAEKTTCEMLNVNLESYSNLWHSIQTLVINAVFFISATQIASALPSLKIVIKANFKIEQQLLSYAKAVVRDNQFQAEGKHFSEP